MIRVWYSNQLERLANRLVENLSIGHELSQSRLFSMPPVIVPNQNIETYLKYAVACQAGIAAGLKFHVTESFLAELLPRAKSPYRLLNRALLRAFFLDVLSEESISSPLPEAVQFYLAPAGDNADGYDLRQFQLASRLAGLAWQYGDTRPELLRDWADAKATARRDQFKSAEEWQRDLWARLITRTRKDQSVSWVLPVELFGVLDKVGFDPPSEIHLFGFSYVWTGLREMIQRLSQKSRINIYTLSPCKSFWNSTVSRGHTPLWGETDGLPIVIHWGQPGPELIPAAQDAPGPRVHRGGALRSAA